MKHLFLTMLLTATLATTVSTSARTGETLERQVIAAGATDGVADGFHLMATFGQTAIGDGAANSFLLQHGYWRGSPSCCRIRGDIDHNNAGPDIADPVAVVSYMFQPPSDPPVCEEDGLYMEADINGDGVGPDIADLVHLVSYMFQPPSPAPVDCP